MFLRAVDVSRSAVRRTWTIIPIEIFKMVRWLLGGVPLLVGSVAVSLLLILISKTKKKPFEYEGRQNKEEGFL